MTQTPAGWYPDPTPPTGARPGLRWWDGVRWTEHAAPAPGALPQRRPAGPTTDDGQPLAEWWRRLVAYIIDGVLLDMITSPLLLIFQVRYYHDVFRYLDRVQRTTNTGTTSKPPPFPHHLITDMVWQLVITSAVTYALVFVYSVVMLRWKRQTVGMLALGLRVRRMDADDLPTSNIVIRVLVFVLLAMVPGVGLLNGLWPLWDRRWQALHDKAAHTFVVRVER